MMLAEGLKPNIVSYNALLGAYASHVKHEEALAVFKSHKLTGLRPDVVAYTSLMLMADQDSLEKKRKFLI